MASEKSFGPTNVRWWEFYLVRYLVPSIAGMAIVAWLFASAPDSFRLSLLGGLPDSLSKDAFTLLALAGGLFCYIASYPVLGFHATRCLDSGQSKCWRVWNGYTITAIFTILIVWIQFCDGRFRFCGTYVIVLLFVVTQFCRICAATRQERQEKNASQALASRAYSYLKKLAKARKLELPKQETNSSGKNTRTGPFTIGPNECGCTINHETKYEVGIRDQDADSEKEKDAWRDEVIESYRHLREHGNSAFILVLEIGLAAACYGIIQSGVPAEANKFAAPSAIGILFALWAAPAAWVHMLGQHLERQFSDDEDKPA